MGVFLLLVGISTICALAVLWMKKIYSVWKDMGAPYEEPDLLFGNLKGVGPNSHDGELTERFYKKHKGKGPFVGIFFFLKPIALATDLEFVKTVMIKDFNYFHDRGVFMNEKDEPISAHMFALPGQKWKQIRNKLTPTFTSGKMKIMFPTVVEVGKRLEVKLNEVIQEGKDIDIKALMARFTVDTIGSCAFGLECNSLEDASSEFFQVGMSVFDNPKYGTGVSFLLLVFREYAEKLGLKSFRDEVSEFYKNVVRKTVDYRIANKVHRNDFMELLVKLYQSDGEDHLTFNELLAQAFVFLIAGFETSSTTLQFCFFELAHNPDIQEKTRNHINEILAKHNGELTYEAMMDMKYLDLVINETLRVHPPVGTQLRVASEDYTVPGTKFILKKNTTVMIPTFAIHRDPEFYPDPLRFNPENFTDENIKARPSLAFQPFGEGPRICIGARFAMMQVKIGLISTLLKCKLSLSPKTKLPFKLQSKFFILHVEGGVWLKMEAIS